MTATADAALGRLDRAQPFILFGGIAAGLFLSACKPEEAARIAVSVLTPGLMLVLFMIFLQVPLKQVTAAFSKVKATGLALGLNFIVTPLLAWLLGALFLGAHPDLRIGLFMFLLTPCIDWYLIFTHLSRGNTALGVLLLPWNLILQMVLLPVFLLLFASTIIPVNLGVLLHSVVVYFVLPFVLANLTRCLLESQFGGERVKKKILSRLSPYSLAALTLVIMAMFASQGRVMLSQPDLLLKILLPVGLFFVIIFTLAQIARRAAGLDYPDGACLTCTAIARNSPIALAIAVGAFPEQPLVALTIAIGPLLELPVLLVVSRALLWLNARESCRA
ncbi:MAG: arsenic resistance protein [Bacillota bacterium]